MGGETVQQAPAGRIKRRNIPEKHHEPLAPG